MRDFVRLRERVSQGEALLDDEGKVYRMWGFVVDSVIMSELGRIEEIIREFLLISRPPQQETFREGDLENILRHVISLLDSQAVMNKVWITYEGETGIPFVRCNDNQLKQVFINIVRKKAPDSALPSATAW